VGEYTAVKKDFGSNIDNKVLQERSHSNTLWLRNKLSAKQPRNRIELKKKKKKKNTAGIGMIKV
jgi:hypothetical protein